MSHGATVGGQTHTQTRKQANAGKKTGVAGRRSRWTKEGKIGGLGESLRVTQSPNPFDLKPSVKKFFNNFSHEWFGTNKNTFPFEQGKPSNFELAQYGAKKLRKTMPMDHIAIPGRVLPLRQDDRDSPLDSPVEQLEKPKWKEPIIPRQQQEYHDEYEPKKKEVVEEPKTPMWIMPDAPISLPSHSFGSPPPTAKSIINKRTVAKRMGGY